MMPRTFLVLALMALAAACTSEEPESAAGKHVWQEQTDAIKKAQQVEDLVEETAKKQREAIDAMGR